MFFDDFIARIFCLVLLLFLALVLELLLLVWVCNVRHKFKSGFSVGRAGIALICVMLCCIFCVWLFLLLLRCGDVHPNPGPISCVVMNVNSLRSLNKRLLLRAHIGSFALRPAVICLTETKLDVTVNDAELGLSGYSIYRRDRNSAGGGILVAVDNIYPSKLVAVSSDSETQIVEFRCQKWTVAVANHYRPNCNDRRSLIDLQKILRQFLSHRVYTFNILSGDFNTPDLVPDIQTGQTHWTPCTKLLQEIMLENYLTNLVDEPTRGANILDLACVSNVKLATVVVVAGISDHSCLRVSLSFVPQLHKCVSLLDWARADYAEMQPLCVQFLRGFIVGFDDGSPEMNYLALKTFLHELQRRFVPLRQVQVGKHTFRFPLYIRKAINYKNKLHSQLKRSKAAAPLAVSSVVAPLAVSGVVCMLPLGVGASAPQDTLQLQYLAARARSKSLIRRYKIQILAGLSQAAKSSPRNFWGKINGQRASDHGIPVLRSEDGAMVEDPHLKAEALSRAFFKAFLKEPEICGLGVSAHRLIPASRDIVFSSTGISSQLCKINPYKAQGVDGISSHILKRFGKVFAPAIAMLFQSFFDSGYVPLDWRRAIVHPIPKKKPAPSNPTDYRPISLTCQLCKVFEHVLVSHMHAHFAEYGVLSNAQHGFRSKRSCDTAVISVLHSWAHPLDMGFPVDAVFLDIQKAFDRVPHNRLSLKLKLVGVRGKLLRWIEGFLRNRFFSVRVDGNFSCERVVLSGVPQGSVLGPLLFLVYINDISSMVKSSISIYADDILVYRPLLNYSDCVALQLDLNALAQWSDRWVLSFNVAKCASLRVHLPQAPVRIRPFTYSLHGNPIQTVASFRYLGITISHDLKWQLHITSVVAKANRTLGFLRRNFSAAPRSIKRQLYTTLVRSILESASAAWDPYYLRDIRALELVQNRAARFITGVYQYDASATALKRSCKLELLRARRCIARFNLLHKFSLGVAEIPGLPVIDFANMALFLDAFLRVEGKNTFLYRTIAESEIGADGIPLPVVFSIFDDGG